MEQPPSLTPQFHVDRALLYCRRARQHEYGLLGTRLRRGIRFVNYEQQIIRPSAESTGRFIRILNAVLRPMLEQQSQCDPHVLSTI